jgi:hypothetical protein
MKTRSVQVTPDTKVLIDLIKFNFGTSQQEIVSNGVKMYFEKQMYVRDLKEKDLKKPPIGFEPEVAHKAIAYLKRIGSGVITMGPYSPYFMENGVQVLMPIHCFEYMIADRMIEALSAKEYKKKC